MSDNETRVLASASIDGDSLGASESLFPVFWRNKWIILIFTIVGVGFGYWMYKQKPTTYQASTRLMLRTDTPVNLDTDTGAAVGGLPSGNLMQSLITSDKLLTLAAKDAALQAALSELSDETAIANMLRAGIQFQTITDVRDSADRMIAALHFRGRNPEVCVRAVDAMALAIDAHFDSERESSINSLQRILDNARDVIEKDQRKYENEYKEFREGEGKRLAWDTSEGHAINPHREAQLQYQAERADAEREIRNVETELKFAETIQKNNDALSAVGMIEQLQSLASAIYSMNDLDKVGVNRSAALDAELERINIEKRLLPMVLEYDELTKKYGANHPLVKSLASKIESSRETLNELSKDQSKRIEDLTRQGEKLTEAGQELEQRKVARAKHGVDMYVNTLKEKKKVLEGKLGTLDSKIAEQKKLADEIRNLVEDDKMHRRNIEGVRGTLFELQQQLAALNVADINEGIIVEPLLDKSEAYITGPDLKTDLILYGMLGLATSGLLAFLFEASAKMFRSAEEVTRELRLPVLTHIPLDESRLRKGQASGNDEVSKLDPKLAVVHRPYSAAAEAIRGVRTAILFDRRAYGSKVFQVTSPLPGDGKSTVSANIACSLAQSGKKVLLIDLDLRSPRLSLRFNLDGKQGLTNLLNGEVDPFEAVNSTPVDNLDVLGCGPLPANPAEALTLAELGDVFDWARAQYDFVIVDTPPLLMVTDPSIVTTYVDAAILAMRVRRRCKPNAKEAVGMLRTAGARVMGVIINKVDEVGNGATYKTSASGSYQSIGYGYGDKYRRRYQKEAKASDDYVVTGKSSEEGFSKPILGTDDPSINPMDSSAPLVNISRSKD